MAADSFAQMAHHGAQNHNTLGLFPKSTFELNAVPETVVAVKVNFFTLLFFVAPNAVGAANEVSSRAVARSAPKVRLRFIN
jgi:hypothetical protein